MYSLQDQGFKVHVDYSDDISNITNQFLNENNVRYIVQLLPEGVGEEKRILFRDRQGESSQGTHSA